MTTRFALQTAADVIHDGGVVAYPTEGVYGLGCDPLDADTVYRLLAIKQRSVRAGLILIAAAIEQLEPFLGELEPRATTRLAIPGAEPVTWVAPASHDAPAWITGGRDTIAVRLTLHPVARALCEYSDSPLVSTSANRAGRPAARSALLARKQIGAEVDYFLHGAVGGLDGPTPIRNLITGEVYR